MSSRVPEVRCLPLAIAAALLLSACGGGESAGTSGTAGADSSASFPVGLAVAAPADLAGASGSSTVSAAAAVKAADLSELASQANLIERVLAGDTTLALENVLDLPALFQSTGSDAGCYGPKVLYTSHQDGGGTASGELPGGDVGLWRDLESAGRPCAAAQMSGRVHGVKAQTTQALLMAALMRRTVALDTALAMPAAGASTDLTGALAARIATALPSLGVTVVSATIALDGGAGTYTYRLVLAGGSGTAARRGEVILRHTPGSSAGRYSGVLQIAGFGYDTDPAFVCTDLTDGSGHGQVARVSTVRYSRNGTTVDFGARSARYCGHPTATGSNDAAQVAGFTSAGELDPAVKIRGTTRGSTPGWRGDFTRYAGSFDKDTGTGQFLMAWQAGTGDSHSRMMAATTTINTSSGDRGFEGWFAYGGEISTTSGALLGMICNWAGPGSSHVPGATFQSQRATRPSGMTAWTLTSSKITYAPVRSCSSTTTAFDANGDGSLASGEGVGISANLDAPTGARTTVADELISRGYWQPGLF